MATTAPADKYGQPQFSNNKWYVTKNGQMMEFDPSLYQQGYGYLAPGTKPAKGAVADPPPQYQSNVPMTGDQLATWVLEYASMTGKSPADVRKLIKYGRPVSTAGQNRTADIGPSGKFANYNLPVMPKEQVKPAAVAPTVAPVTKPVVKPTGPAPETPHAKALRLAREGGTGAFSRLYGNKALDPKDPYGVGAEFTRLLNESLGKVPATDDDVSKYVNYDDMFSTALNTRTGAERNKLSSAYKTATPYGWQNKYFADTSDDTILRQILGTQAQDTSANLKRQLDRGQMSQGAYDYAIKQLGYDPTGKNYTGLSAGAYQTLQDLGGGVLSGYRTGLGDVANEFNNQITNYSLGSQVNPALLNTNLTNKANTYRGGMEGDIRKALGTTQLYDPNKLIASAGNASGVSNQPVQGSTPQGTGRVLTEEEQRSQGTSGVF